MVALFAPAPPERRADALVLAERRGARPITAAGTDVVALDVDAFRRAAGLEARTVADLPAAGARTPLAARPLGLELADGRQLLLTLDTVARGDAEHSTWIGGIAGIDGSRAWITTDARAAYGLIDLAGERYALDPVDGGATSLHYLHRLDLGKLAQNRCGSGRLPTFAKHLASGSAPSKPTPRPVVPAALAAKTAPVTVGVIIYWSPAAAAGKWSLPALSWWMIDSMNDAFALAEVPHRVTLQLTRLATFSESGNPRTDLDNSLAIPGLAADRSDYQGDMVVTITDASANLPGNFLRGVAAPFGSHEGSGNPPPLVPPVAVVTDDWAMGDFTFHHEVGHVFGAAHSPFDPPGSVSWLPFGKGYMDGPSSWFTLMGGYDTCASGNPPTCPGLYRINRWSSIKPGQSCLGRPIGVAGVSEVDRSHELLMPAVAALR